MFKHFKGVPKLICKRVPDQQLSLNTPLSVANYTQTKTDENHKINLSCTFSEHFRSENSQKNCLLHVFWADSIVIAGAILSKKG